MAEHYVTERIRLYPTSGQKDQFFAFAGVDNYVWNQTKEFADAYYVEHAKMPSQRVLLDNLNRNIQAQGFVSEAEYHTRRDPVFRYRKALIRAVKAKKGFPKFHSLKWTYKRSFYVREDRTRQIDANHFHIPKAGRIRSIFVQDLPKIKQARVVYDGKYWYLHAVVLKEYEPVETTEESLGIDMGLHDALVTSEGYSSGRLSDDSNYRKALWKKKQLQRKLARQQKERKKRENAAKQIDADFRGGERSKRELSVKSRLARVERHLAYLRQNFIRQSVTTALKDNPGKVVIEDLNVSGMMKNHHLARAVGEVGMYQARTWIEWLSLRDGFELVVADRFFPSTQLCPDCGSLNKHALSTREYSCDCGYSCQRDLHAARNLARY